MARKLTLEEAQQVLDTRFPNSGIALKSYSGNVYPGVLELSDGTLYHFPRFSNLSRFPDTESLRAYLERHPLNARGIPPPHRPHLRNRRPKYHAAQLRTQIPNPKPQP